MGYPPMESLAMESLPMGYRLTESLPMGYRLTESLPMQETSHTASNPAMEEVSLTEASSGTLVGIIKKLLFTMKRRI